MGFGATVDVNETKLKFMGNLTLNLWDCGGQKNLMKAYFTTQKEIIFKNVEVLIYVFDVESNDEDDIAAYKTAIQNLKAYSKNANIFILVHKMDKIEETKKKDVLEQKRKQISMVTEELQMTLKEVFGTSIWDESLYQAWSQIVQLLLPNMPFIKESLSQFCVICDCDEVVLFEKTTFLIIAYSENKNTKEILKYERISNIIKQFKLSCNKNTGANIKKIMVKKENTSVIIEEFTENTYIMIVYSDDKIQSGAVELNIEIARKFFAKK